MSGVIILTLVLGVLGGFFLPSDYKDVIDQFSGWVLYALIFFVGIDLGLNKEIFGKIKKLGVKILLVPFGALLGSFVGGVIISFFVGESMKDSLAVAMGMGWYSFSGILIAEAGNAYLGALAFLTNVMREIMAFIVIPFIAKNMGYYCSIAPAGATSMDTTLGIISRNTDSKTAVVAFISGVIITLCVPIIVPIFV
ncbi:MAG: lysine exporter LysO family protein [Anaerotignaceae bacterium]